MLLIEGRGRVWFIKGLLLGGKQACDRQGDGHKRMSGRREGEKMKGLLKYKKKIRPGQELNLRLCSNTLQSIPEDPGETRGQPRKRRVEVLTISGEVGVCGTVPYR